VNGRCRFRPAFIATSLVSFELQFTVPQATSCNEKAVQEIWPGKSLRQKIIDGTPAIVGSCMALTTSGIATGPWHAGKRSSSGCEAEKNDRHGAWVT